jgi:hypothetical protein
VLSGARLGNREPDWPRAGDLYGFCPFWPLPGPAARLRQRGPCGKNRPPAGAFLGPILLYRACCRSSVVEHSIGNGEVDSSILSGSTSFSTKSTNCGFAGDGRAFRCLLPRGVGLMLGQRIPVEAFTDILTTAGVEIMVVKARHVSHQPRGGNATSRISSSEYPSTSTASVGAIFAAAIRFVHRRRRESGSGRRRSRPRGPCW